MKLIDVSNLCNRRNSRETPRAKIRGVATDMACLHCGTRLTITIVMARRTCPKCQKEFLIENNLPKKPGSEKKPSESVHVTRTHKRTKSR
jgi:predicted RNA-binding Zn-ribbon protein involved in translation (DUF1610 family)